MSPTDSMTGTVWRTPALRIEQVSVPAGVRMRGHGHDVPHLCFLSRGGFRERDAGGIREVAPGTLRSSPSGDTHDLAFTADSTCLLVLVEGDPASVTPSLLPHRQFVDARRTRGLMHDLMEALHEGRPPSPFDIETLALELLAVTEREERAGSGPPGWLERVRQWIRDTAGRPPAPAELAADAGYHPVYVARAFRRHFGVGLGQYARLVRAEHGRTLLAATDTPLAQVAFRAGYADQSHMTREMRRVFGTTPARVRRRAGRMVEVASIQDADSPPAQ